MWENYKGTMIWDLIIQPGPDYFVHLVLSLKSQAKEEVTEMNERFVLKTSK